MNLLSVIAQTKLLDDSGITLDSQRCIRAHTRFSNCKKCVSSCPTGAIRLDTPITLDAEKCVNCGLCLRICPTDAFTGKDGVSDLLDCASKVGTRNVIELACALHPVPQTGPGNVNAVIRTNECLASLGVSTYLRLLNSGTTQVIVRLDNCAGCKIAPIVPYIEQTLETVHDLFTGTSDTDKIHAIKQSGDDWRIRPVYQAKNPPVSRRELFSMFSLEGKRFVAELSTNINNSSSDAKAPSRERRRLMMVLRLMASSQIISPQLSRRDLGIVRLAADSNCTACGTCARLCPTGALEFTTSTTGTYQLMFSTSTCMDCGTCTSVCQARALRRDGIPNLPEILSQEPIVLQAGSLRVCAKCGAQFASSDQGNLCQICTARQQNSLYVRRKPALQPQHNADRSV